MADVHPYHRRNSWAHFCPSSFHEGFDRSGYFEPRRYRRGSIRIKSVCDTYDLAPNLDRPQFHPHQRLSRRLSTSKEHAKRFIRSVLASRTTITRSCSNASDPSSCDLESATAEGGYKPVISRNMRSGLRGSIGGPVSGMVSRPSLSEDVRQASDATARAQGMNVMPGTDPTAKSLVSGSGVSVSINLAEPALFLQGFEQNDMAGGNTAMLRGTLHLRVTKAAKIKAVTLKFKGRATTKWPEGDTPRFTMSKITTNDIQVSLHAKSTLKRLTTS